MLILMSACNINVTIKRINGDTITPIMIFNRIKGVKKFFLESAYSFSDKKRYTYIGVNPYKSYTAQNDKVVEKNYHTGTQISYEGDIFRLLKYIVPEPINETEFSFTGGLLGYVSFPGTSQIMQNEGSENIPQYQFDLYETVIIYDHHNEEIILFHNALSERVSEEIFKELIHQINTAEENEENEYELGSFSSELTDEKYCKLIQDAKQRVLHGEAMQLVVSRRFQADFSGNAFSLYRNLRKDTKAPYMYYVQYEDFSLIGASPEGILKIKGNEVNIVSVTGARPRGNSPREDLQVELSLLQNAKEIHSHNILVDMTTKDLSAICLDGSVELLDYMKPTQFKHSIRLSTEIRGTLHPLTHPVEALKKLLPCASATGVPKELAAQIISEIEPTARTYYGGVLGFFSLNGNVDFTLLQQTLKIKGDKAYIQAGANILPDTTDIDAIVETRKKIKAFLLIDNKV